MIRSPGVYENLCGDLMMPALAHALCVDMCSTRGERRRPFTQSPPLFGGGSHPAEDAEDNQYQEFQEFHSETNEF